MFDPKKYYHDRYFKLKSEHRCVACGDPLEEGRTNLLCDVCWEKRKAALRKHHKKKRRELLGK